MLCINNTSTDAYFNIAAEEYFLKNSPESIFMLYRNEPSVIIGKHQDIWTEVNIEYAKQHQLKMVRRYSGGGAVFHDLGNLNLTFIESSNNLEFDKFTNLIAAMLATLGIHTESNSRRALTVNGYKVSGSAQGVYKNRIIYHATLLYSSDLSKLKASLEGSMLAGLAGRPHKLSVRSVKSSVTNLIDYLDHKIDVSGFSEFVMSYFLKKSSNNTLYELSEEEVRKIQFLRNNKYSTPDWIYNASVLHDKNKHKVDLLSVINT